MKINKHVKGKMSLLRQEGKIMKITYIVQEPTKNRLKRQSPNHLLKKNLQAFSDSLPNRGQEETLQDYNEWNHKADPKINLHVPGINEKSSHSEPELKNLTLEMLHCIYPQENWLHVFTDGSAEGAIKNGGAGVYIRYPSGSTESHATPTGKNSTNFRAESEALLQATKILNQKENLPENTVFLTDCKSILQNVISKENDQITNKIKTEIESLQHKTNISLQWIPSHCGIGGNENADKLSKEGSRLEQPNNPISYCEIKTIIKSNMNSKWKETHNLEREDNISQLGRGDQVLIFRLRTGHCQLLSHMYKLKLSHTNECQCGTSIQTVEHILQDCPVFTQLRGETWCGGMEIHTKLWGQAAELRKTAEFVRQTGLRI